MAVVGGTRSPGEGDPQRARHAKPAWARSLPWSRGDGQCGHGSSGVLALGFLSARRFWRSVNEQLSRGFWVTQEDRLGHTRELSFHVVRELCAFNGPPWYHHNQPALRTADHGQSSEFAIGAVGPVVEGGLGLLRLFLGQATNHNLLPRRSIKGQVAIKWRWDSRWKIRLLRAHGIIPPAR